MNLNDGIKYVVIAAIAYFLLRGLTQNGVDNNKIIIAVVSLIVIIILINWASNRNCPRKLGKLAEPYQITDPPIVNSIYPGPPNKNPQLPVQPYEDITVVDADVRDFEDIVGINKETLAKLNENERKAMSKIMGTYQDEMVYTSSHPFNTIPLGTQIYGYTYLPPENWFRAYERPPVCVTDKRCPGCPVASGSTAGLMEFDTSNNVMGAEGINLRYIRNVLNKKLN